MSYIDEKWTIQKMATAAAITHKNLQRSDQVWKPPATSEFLVELVNGTALNSIILVEIEAVREYCRLLVRVTDCDHRKLQARDTLLTLDEVQKENRGVKYLILDGGNRTDKIRGFYNGTEKLPKSTEIINAIGKTIGVLTEKAMTYPELVQVHDRCEHFEMHFSSAELVPVRIIKSFTWKMLETMFVRINSGNPLWDMEKLWVETTEYSKAIRRLYSQYESQIKAPYGSVKEEYFNVLRRDAVKVIVQSGMTFENEKADLKHKSVEKFWRRNGSNMASKTYEHMEAFTKALINLDLETNHKIIYGTPITKKWMLSCAMHVITELIREDHVIEPSNASKYARAIFAAIKDLHDVAKLEHSEDNIKAKDAGIPLPSKSNYNYHHMSNHLTAPARNKFLPRLMDEFVAPELVKLGLAKQQSQKVKQEQRTALQE
jgi:hypothetical protein